MKMDFITRVGIGFVAGLFLSGPAFATGIAPPNYAFLINGPGNLIKNGGQAIWACSWNFKMQSGASIGGNPPQASGGTMTGGTAPGGTNCSVMTIEPTTWSITSSNGTGGSGVFHGLSFLQSGSTFCSTYSDVPFTITNNGDAPSTFTFNYPTIGQCTFAANMNTAADLNVVS